MKYFEGIKTVEEHKKERAELDERNRQENLKKQVQDVKTAIEKLYSQGKYSSRKETLYHRLDPELIAELEELGFKVKINAPVSFEPGQMTTTEISI